MDRRFPSSGTLLARRVRLPDRRILGMGKSKPASVTRPSRPMLGIGITDSRFRPVFRYCGNASPMDSNSLIQERVSYKKRKTMRQEHLANIQAAYKVAVAERINSANSPRRLLCAGNYRSNRLFEPILVRSRSNGPEVLPEGSPQDHRTISGRKPRVVVFVACGTSGARGLRAKLASAARKAGYCRG